jgi:molybdate transport system substrate-binding protein
VHDAQALKTAILHSPTLSYSTGPSGVYLEKMFDQWGILSTLRDRIVVPPPGTPVGQLLAQGKVALGFQQMSELIGVAGIEIVGTLPPDVAYITTFSSSISGACAANATRFAQAQQFHEFLVSDAAELIKQQQGMFWR